MNVGRRAFCRILNGFTRCSRLAISSSSPSSSKPSLTNKSKLATLGVLSVGSGALYAYYSNSSVNRTAVPDSGSMNHLLEESPPYFQPARKIRYPEDTSGLKITLFQFQTCPFCCKVRAFLDYYGISYDVIEVNSVMRSEIKWSGYKKVPILVVQTRDGKFLQLNDSSMIISALLSYFKGSSKDLEKIVSYYPQVQSKDENGKTKVEIRNKYFVMYEERESDPKAVKEEVHWRKWVDNVFVHTISPNVYRTPLEALEAFKWFEIAGDWKNTFSFIERNVVIYVGAAAMWIIGKRLKSRYNLKDDVRESIYDECDRWMKALSSKNSPFMGGESPNAADLSFYGTLNAFEGCQSFQDILASTKLREWFKNTKWAVGSRKGASLISKK